MMHSFELVMIFYIITYQPNFVTKNLIDRGKNGN